MVHLVIFQVVFLFVIVSRCQIHVGIIAGGLFSVCVMDEFNSYGSNSYSGVYRIVGGVNKVKDSTWVPWAGNGALPVHRISCANNSIYALGEQDAYNRRVRKIESPTATVDTAGALMQFDMYNTGVLNGVNFQSHAYRYEEGSVWTYSVARYDFKIVTPIRADSSGGVMAVVTTPSEHMVYFPSGVTGSLIEFYPTGVPSGYYEVVKSIKPEDQIFVYFKNVNDIYVIRYPQYTTLTILEFTNRPILFTEIDIAYDGTLSIVGDQYSASDFTTSFAYLLSHSCNGTSAKLSTACFGRGYCMWEDHCVCDPGFYGSNCDIVECGEHLSNETGIVCHGHGSCSNLDSKCHCEGGFYGPLCDIVVCFGDWSNVSNACNQSKDVDALCVEPNTCNCSDSLLYFGQKCEFTYCNQTLSNDTTVCSQKGNCTAYDTCKCVKNAAGKLCEFHTCFDVSSDSNLTCSGHGVCESIDKCHCTAEYFGSTCNVTTCAGIFSNETRSVCNYGNGTCIDHNICECKNGYYDPILGPYDRCRLYDCDGYVFDHSDREMVCNGHGECIGPERCECRNETIYNVSDYCNWNCYGVNRKKIGSVCSGSGVCVSSNNCSCETGYLGDDCEEWTCFEVHQFDTNNVCGGHGLCVEKDDCYCNMNYRSSIPNGECDQWFCNKIFRSELEVCQSRGNCTAHDTCECSGGYKGENCEYHLCGQYRMDDVENVCSGNGECVSPDTCECESGFESPESECDLNVVAIAVAVPVAVVLLGGVSVVTLSVLCLVSMLICCVISFSVCCVISCIVCCGCCTFWCCFCVWTGIFARQAFSIKKFSKLRNIDILIKEQEMEDDTSIAHIKINRNLFEIDMQEIKVISILGEGGSSSVVYKAKWKGRFVAFKCFRTRQLCTHQNSFDEFEREVEVMGSVNHPNIIQFFGCSIQPPRVGILMEFAEKGDLFVFLRRYSTTSEVNVGEKLYYPYEEKFRFCTEIISAFDYLHSRSIIHRDLKLENILVDGKEQTKLMDFGLSRCVERMSQQKTVGIGTQIYMAPEIVDGKYDHQVDVFSFAMVMFIMFSENYDPYGNIEEMNISVKVYNDPKFRPNLQELRKCVPEKDVRWISGIIKRCWKHKSSERHSFSDLTKLFEMKATEKEMNKKDDIAEASSSSDEEDLSKDEKIKKLEEQVNQLEDTVEDLEGKLKEKDDEISKLRKNQ